MNKTIIFVSIAICLVFGCAVTQRISECPEHHVKLKEVPILYGLPGPDAVKQRDRGEAALGGCVIAENSPKTALICPIDHKILGYGKP